LAASHWVRSRAREANLAQPDTLSRAFQVRKWGSMASPAQVNRGGVIRVEGCDQRSSLLISALERVLTSLDMECPRLAHNAEVRLVRKWGMAFANTG
jgi:hypothetical protein